MSGAVAALLLCAALLALALGVRRTRAGDRDDDPRPRLRRSARVHPLQAAIAATELAASLRAGRALAPSIERAAAATPAPLGPELARTAADLSLGEPVADALGALEARCARPEVRALVAAVAVHGRSGGDLARTLDDLARRMRVAHRLAGELRAATAQAKMTVWLVGAMPVAAGLLMQLVASGLVHRTLAHPAGRAIVVTSLLLQALGWLLVWRILRGVR